MIYLDANATEVVRPAAREAALMAMDLPGNPSSVHGAGRAARKVLETARETIALQLGGCASRLVFTSGGTEANALAVHALGLGRRLIVGATEHAAILAACPGADVVPVDAQGVVDLGALEEVLAVNAPALVCLMLANNETGTLQPVARAAEICQRHGANLHVDAVQAFGRIAVDLTELGATSVAVSAHKLGGIKGAGALIFAADAPVRPLFNGGGQERGWRGGTPALPAIAAFAAAASDAPPDLAPLRNELETLARACGALVMGEGAERLPNTSCLAFPGMAAETQVIAMDMAGFQVSAGSACSSGKVARSHVLAAMGQGERAGQALRVSLSWSSTRDDVLAFGQAYDCMTTKARQKMAGVS